MCDTKLPDEFAELQILADVFAMSDDVDRENATDAADPAMRRKLVEMVWPKLGATNAYLDDHDDESAHSLGNLAECACEVAIEIGHP